MVEYLEVWLYFLTEVSPKKKKKKHIILEETHHGSE